MTTLVRPLAHAPEPRSTHVLVALAVDGLCVGRPGRAPLVPPVLWPFSLPPPTLLFVIIPECASPLYTDQATDSRAVRGG